MIEAPPFTCPYCDKQIPSGCERCPECGAGLVESKEVHPLSMIFLTFIAIPLCSFGGCVVATFATNSEPVARVSAVLVLLINVIAWVRFYRWRKYG